jgi:hypothetical protein
MGDACQTGMRGAGGGAQKNKKKPAQERRLFCV